MRSERNEQLLREQLAYYRARAPEYDESLRGHGRYAAAPPPPEGTADEWARIVQAVHGAGTGLNVLELACGTGIWTRELLHVARSITALDGAPEMIALNRASVADERVRYGQVDLFE
jgi:2-polyprenyl-3-methyl-5-hydroxy-6-metoxy-1,4-benzoquinol methylase